MDLLDRLLEHDAWTTRQFLLLCHDLTDEQLDREFDIAHRTVRATFDHIIYNIEVWANLMAGVEASAEEKKRSRGRSIPEMVERLDSAAATHARVARAIAARGAWDERWLDTWENQPVEQTYGGAIAHVITHGMHHRAQLLYMMRLLGMTSLPEGDVLSWEKQSGIAPQQTR